MLKSRVPLLSTYNGPSYLMHAVETLHALGVPRRNVRLTPIIGFALTPEVGSYYRESNLAELDRIVPSQLSVRLSINVRADRRLQSLLPLVAIGLAPQREAVQWREQRESARDAYHRLYARLGEIDPEWTNSEAPAERLARQLCTQFPDLREADFRVASRTGGPVLRPGDWEAWRKPFLGMPTTDRIANETPYRSVQELVEVFLTEAMLALATAEMMGGFDYLLPIEPEGRPIDITITRDSDVREVTKWLHTYPHHPLPVSSYPERSAREQAEWNEYFQAHPEHDDIFETASRLWTEEDPSIISLYREVKEQYDGDRLDAITPDEMLSFARKHLPDYVPRYPHQFAVTGGINLEGILIGLIEKWLEDGPFLGVDEEDWLLFTPTQRAILCGLLMQRREALDQCALFQAAVRTLVDPGIETYLETYQPEPVRLGKPLAQPNRTLSLSGVVALHAPEMLVKLPFDRTRDERAGQVESKLRVIARLFLPVHIPLRTVWQVERPVLGRTAFLQHGPGSVPPKPPYARLAES